jgi:hypothetical protein
MKKATNLTALFGFLTAVVGLFQVMWTTEPWWHKDNAAVATAAERPPVPPEAEDDPHMLMAQGTPTEAPMKWGYYLIGLGVAAAVLAVGYRLVDRKSTA